jgi:hypothetical protein
LADAAEALKHRGYRRVVLAGQSFAALISLIATGLSEAVESVIATAPAAYGSAESNPSGFAQIGTGFPVIGNRKHGPCRGRLPHPAGPHGDA